MNIIQIIDYILYIFIVFLWISEKGKYYIEIIIIICLGYSVLESVASVPFYNFVLSSVLFRQFFHVGKLSNFIFKTYSRVTTAAICLMPENFFQTQKVSQQPFILICRIEATLKQMNQSNSNFEIIKGECLHFFCKILRLLYNFTCLLFWYIDITTLK